jgi:hypothetical protein
MKIFKTNPPNDPYREDYDELLRLMQIPDIKKIIFHKLAVLKESFKDTIEKFDFKEPNQHIMDGNIIHLNPREFYFNTADQREREFFEFVKENKEFRDMILNEFYSIYKSLYREKRDED